VARDMLYLLISGTTFWRVLFAPTLFRVAHGAILAVQVNTAPPCIRVQKTNWPAMFSSYWVAGSPY